MGEIVLKFTSENELGRIPIEVLKKMKSVVA